MNVMITVDNHPIFKKGDLCMHVKEDIDGIMVSKDYENVYFCHNDHYEYYVDRCPICGAKEESHYEDHLCRLHKDERGICTVCRKPFQNCIYNGIECKGYIQGGCSIECIANDFF